MDEWYFARWATGSSLSYWPDLQTCFNEVYQADKPIGEIYDATAQILDLFASLNFKSTFFFTGQMANFYPDLVRMVANGGHEIACHNYYHLDYEYETREKFCQNLTDSKALLEDLSGSEVIGYRSPNSSVPATMIGDLEKSGFHYNSSVTPTRRFMGKFGAFTDAPHRPYCPSYADIAVEGNSHIWEFPWATLPYLNLPAGSGIMHRIGGNIYNSIALNFSLRLGHTSYYFHPYEIQESPFLASFTNLNLKTRIFNRRIGRHYLSDLKRFLNHHRLALISGKELLQLCEQTNLPKK